MSLKDELDKYCKDRFRLQWEMREGQKIPSSEDVALGNKGVHFERATFLYADLAGSTSMVEVHGWEKSAEVYKSFLYGVAKIVRAEGGTIMSYDGDRLMAVWANGSQTSDAAKCALKIHYFVLKILRPALKKQYPNSSLLVKQCVGIDTSEARTTRNGIRGGNDLVWIGKAPNYAAKLSDYSSSAPTWITSRAYNQLNEDSKLGGKDKTNMWTSSSWNEEGGSTIYKSSWYWPIK